MKTMRFFNYLGTALIIGLFTFTFTSCDDEAPSFENCTNGIDDDGDGLVDCNDPDCANFSGCVTTGDPTVELGGNVGTRTLYPDTIYVIDRFTYVGDGDILTILPGTIIKAKTGDGADASALIIARGGKILAEGTASQPIIFTSINDGIAVGEKASTLNPAIDAGLWGGLIVLGKAPISATVAKGDTETAVEGVPETFTFGIYGGSVPADNSGKLKYVSIRFTGTKLATNSEIQGLTLGGVGSLTEVENIEIISSDDDGIEIFGGTVNVNKALIVYQADDGLDFDQSYDGTVSNSVVVTFNPSEGNDALELDGPEGPSNTTGLYTITNCTFINKGGDGRAAMLKSASQGTITNCVFEDFTNWIFVDGGSANTNFTNGTLQITNSEFDAASLDGLFATSADSTTNANSIASFEAAGNVATTTFTKGAVADFSWTWANTLNLID